MAGAISVFVIDRLDQAIAPSRHDGLMTGGEQPLAPPIRIVAAITQYLRTLPWRHERWGLRHIVALAASDDKTHGIPLGRQAVTRLPSIGDRHFSVNIFQ